jgi:hypothetical protein
MVLVDQAQEHRKVGGRVAAAQLQLAQLRAQTRVQIRVAFRGVRGSALTSVVVAPGAPSGDSVSVRKV